MYQKYLQMIVIFLAMMPGAQAAREKNKTPVPQDFAYAAPLRINSQAALHKLSLPKFIYQTVVRPDLGDMRVFNSKGEVVPHAVRQPLLRDVKSLAPVEVQIYPLYGKPNQNLDQLSIKVRQRRGGTVVNIDSDSGENSKKLIGYLLVTEGIKQPMKALNLNWGNKARDFVGRVRVERSDDLRRWLTVTYNAPVAYLQYGGHRLERRTIELGHLKTNFLRLSWPGKQTPLKLISIKAELADKVVDRSRQWHSATAMVEAEKPGEYFFDLKGGMPVDRLELRLAQRNTLVSASLYSRSRVTDEWQLRTGGLLYDLQINGDALKNPRFQVRPLTHRYWKLKVEQKEGGLGKGMPQLRVGWLPQQLVFIARGEAPFRLAYGSVRPHVQGADFQVDRLINQFSGKDKLGMKQATIGNPVELAGPIALKPAWAETVAWKKWLLWGVLGLGVLLLAWMAISLMRQMGQGSGDQAPDAGEKKAENG
ncbi:MAG: DUF3999 domain-containing protein [Gammaproteobacteria bacterium]|nr:MAG: DUF3999 domain-containing protein [Gammaproteobacteria bacterium]